MSFLDWSSRWPWIAGAVLLLGGFLWANTRFVLLAFESQPECVLNDTALHDETPNEGAMKDRSVNGRNENDERRSGQNPDVTSAGTRVPAYRAAKPAC